MKKLSALLLVLCMLLCFAGCKGSSGGSSSGIAGNESGQIGEFNPLSGLNDLSKSAVGKRPIAIMVNNIKISLPQRGISNADLCYEVLAEGGITRIMAVFADINKIPDTGSVRSARDYYIDLAVSHNSVFVHFGGSPTALKTIKEKNIDSLNGLYLYPTGFYRDQNRVGKIPIEHTVFTDGQMLLKAAEKRKINLSGKTQNAFNFGDVDVVLSQGSAATNITVPFSSSTKATFTYDSESGLYMVGQYGKNYVDGATGEQVGVTNVLVLETEIGEIPGDSYLRCRARMTGEGEGQFFCGGKTVDIKWSKADRNSQFVYTLTDGTPLILGQGVSHVYIIDPTRSTLTVE